MIHAVIMAGGSGTRFWPLSRRAEPKQFLRLSGERSLIQMAFDRCQPWIPAERSWVVTNERLAHTTHHHLPEIPTSHVLLEPCARNTAPCVALAAACIVQEDPDAKMLVMPADHVIGPPEAFRKAVENAVALVEEDPQRLVLFGVPPTYPSTGFGYIERSDQIGQSGYKVSSFREKPNRDTAEDYIRQGMFYWNCGIFVWRASQILESIKEHAPQIHEHTMSLVDHIGKDNWQEQLALTFPKMKSISIDYAVLEHDHHIAVVEAPFDWDDVGSWTAMQRLKDSDENHNTVIGTHVGVETTNCIIRSTDDHVIGTIGINNCIIVHTPDGTLVADRHDENAVRQIVELLEEHGHERFL